MASVEIIEVRQHRPWHARLRGCQLEAPAPGRCTESPTVELAGWVLAQDGPAAAVELVCGGAVFGRVPVDTPRPDVAAAFPDVPGAGAAGFRTAGVPALGERDYEVRAVLRDQARVPLGSLRLRRTGPAGHRACPLVAVVIPCYRQARFLGEAIESALSQTYPNLEILVVDDGSPDHTAAVAARYPGVRYVRRQNGGLPAARNTGLRHATGDFIVFLDADDRLLPGAVQAGLDCFAAHPECAFVSGEYRYITSDGCLFWVSGDHNIRTDHYLELLRRNYIEMHATVMYRRPVVEAVGGFSTELRSCEDYDLYLRIARDHPVHCHGKVVAEYRRHSANMSLNIPRMFEYALAVHRSQRVHVRGDARRRQAYETGKRFWRKAYGEQLLAQARFAVWQRDWRRARHAVLALLRYHPQALDSVLGPAPIPQAAGGSNGSCNHAAKPEGAPSLRRKGG